jgi:hypothetical protein
MKYDRHFHYLAVKTGMSHLLATAGIKTETASFDGREDV